MCSTAVHRNETAEGNEDARGAIPSLPQHGGSIPTCYVLSLAWPMILSMLSFTIMSFTDTLFVSWLGPSPTAAVVLGNIIAFQLIALPMGLLGAVRTMVAQDFGAQRHERHGVTLTTCLALGMGMGAACLLALPWHKDLFALAGGSQAQSVLGAGYFFWRLLSFPAVGLRIALDNYFAGIGDTRTPMAVNLIGNFLNVPLTYVLVFGAGPIPRMEVEGAALATLYSSLASALLGLLAVRWRPHAWRLYTWGPRRVSADAARRLLRLGGPMGMQFFLEIGSFNFVNLMIARVGDAAMAASGIIVQIIGVSFLPASGLAGAASILVGQFQGANRTDLALSAANRTFGVTVVYMGACALIMILLPGWLMGLFSDDPTVRSIGVSLLYLVASFQVMDAVGTVAYGVLQGAGDTVWPMVFGVAGGWVIMAPLALILVYQFDMGALGAWIAKSAHIIVFAGFLLFRFRQGRWKSMRP